MTRERVTKKKNRTYMSSAGEQIFAQVSDIEITHLFSYRRRELLVNSRVDFIRIRLMLHSYSRGKMLLTQINALSRRIAPRSGGSTRKDVV